MFLSVLEQIVNQLESIEKSQLGQSDVKFDGSTRLSILALKIIRQCNERLEVEVLARRESSSRIQVNARPHLVFDYRISVLLIQYAV